MAKNKNQQQLVESPQAATIRSVQYVERSGPLPAPSELAAYNEVFPGAAERIVKMAEAQSEHRMGIEKHVIHSQQSQVKRGQYFGLFVVLFVVSFATYAAVSGAQTFASVLGGWDNRNWFGDRILGWKIHAEKRPFRESESHARAAVLI